MPRHAKLTKVQRNRGLIAGLKKHAAVFEGQGIGSASALVARFQAQLDALDAVAAKHAAWQQALAEEQHLEAEIRKLTRRVTNLVLAAFGEKDVQRLNDFGLKPRTRAKMSAEKMRLTVEKRNATRKARGAMSKRQKKALRRVR
jgi:hypothetical protein